MCSNCSLIARGQEDTFLPLKIEADLYPERSRCNRFAIDFPHQIFGQGGCSHVESVTGLDLQAIVDK